jgi:hypothetical protein
MVAVKNSGPTDEELNTRALRLLQQQLHERVHGRTP